MSNAAAADYVTNRNVYRHFAPRQHQFPIATSPRRSSFHTKCRLLTVRELILCIHILPCRWADATALADILAGEISNLVRCARCTCKRRDACGLRWSIFRCGYSANVKPALNINKKTKSTEINEYILLSKEHSSTQYYCIKITDFRT